MKLSEILTPSFRTLGRELGLKVEMFDGHLVVIAPMWRRALSAESQFCKAVVSAGYLTERQMLRAARRYRLGSTRQGGVIFWQINEHDEICDGKVMYYREDCHRDKQHHPTWVSTLLARRYRWADNDTLTTRHCLFGLHLLNTTTDSTNTLTTRSSSAGLLPKGRKNYTDFTNYEPQRNIVENDKNNSFNSLNSLSKKTIAVVESEKSAVILSEHFPQHLWLATGGLGNVQPEKFRPLRGHKVILFPDTDPEGKTFRSWYDAAQTVMRQPFWEDSPPITVSSLLEQQASSEQKAAKIDLVDFLPTISS